MHLCCSGSSVWSDRGPCAVTSCAVARPWPCPGQGLAMARAWPKPKQKTPPGAFPRSIGKACRGDSRGVIWLNRCLGMISSVAQIAIILSGETEDASRGPSSRIVGKDCRGDSCGDIFLDISISVSEGPPKPIHMCGHGFLDQAPGGDGLCWVGLVGGVGGGQGGGAALGARRAVRTDVGPSQHGCRAFSAQTSGRPRTDVGPSKHRRRALLARTDIGPSPRSRRALPAQMSGRP